MYGSSTMKDRKSKFRSRQAQIKLKPFFKLRCLELI